MIQTTIISKEKKRLNYFYDIEDEFVILYFYRFVLWYHIFLSLYDIVSLSNRECMAPTEMYTLEISRY